MKNCEPYHGPRGRKNTFLQILTLFLVLLAAPLVSHGQYGTNMYDAIPMGQLYEYDYYGDSRNNAYHNGIYYQDYYSSGYYSNAQPSPDVWYTFTVSSAVDLDLSFCGGTLDVYAHLLDDYGTELANNSATGCYLGYGNLAPGTYYIVVEGWGNTTGNYYLSMYTFPGTPTISLPGANMSNAIDAGVLAQGVPFSDTRSNADPLLGNDMGQPSYDIYYKFTLSAPAEVDLSHCGSGIDTYMHLLNSTGLILTSNDDNNIDPDLPCPGMQSHIRASLPAGTYYVVSEGYNTYTGNITTSISIVPTASQLPVISYPGLSGLVIGVPVNLLPTNTGGAVGTGQGTVSTFAGSGVMGFANGTGSSASFNQPAGGVFDAAGNLYVADVFNHRIRKITPAGVVSTFAGSGAVGSAGGMGTAASFNKPYRLAKDGSGNIYVSDRGGNRIRKITPAGMVSTFAGSGVKGFANGSATVAAFNDPSGIAVDGSGNVYVSEQGNHRIRKITPSGTVSTLAGSGSTGSANGTGGSASFNYPLGMAIDASGNLYVADYNNNKIRRVTLSGVVTTFAGSGSSGSADGPSGSATFSSPLDIGVDASGNVHLTDANHKIRKITGGSVSTVAGTGQAGSANGPYLSASFRMPHGLSFDSQGNTYVADTENHLVRKLGSSPAYSISPALPAGLTFNTTTGAISGTPAAASPATNYTVTASNTAGSSTVILAIAVVSAAAQPSQDKNYIKTTTYREPFTAVPPAPSISDAMVEVAYIDGLGRPLQQVSVKGSPDGQKDIVVPTAYDAFGRQDKSYLPFATATGAGGLYKENAINVQASFYNSPPTGVVQIPQAGGVTPSFAQTVFEASPLNRVLEQGAPGAAWQPAETRGTTGRTVLSEQATNNQTAFSSLSETRQVALYGVSLSSTGVPTLTLNGIYNANQLYVTITKDENWTDQQAHLRAGTVEEYTDKQGRVILKRTFNEKDNELEMLSTYYVYDDFGNLSFVLPPGIDPDRDSGVPTATELEHFAYRYRYDGRNRLVEKQLPGKGVEYIVYNQIDQVVATQDAKQRENHQWLVSKYDGLGRNILAGIWDNGNTHISSQNLQALVNVQDPANLKETRVSSGWTAYSNVSFPTSHIVTMLTLQYYDDYDIPGLPSAYVRTESQMTRGLPTVMRTKVLDQGGYMDNMLWEVSYYDDKGRVSRQIVQHFKGGGSASDHNYDEIENEYSFTGQLEKSIQKHHAGSVTIPAVTVTTDQTYDHMDRPLDTWNTVDYGTPTLLARKGYNEIGQNISKKLHSTDNGINFLNTESYSYNARGWLKGQSGPRFSMELDYELGPNPQYNGNISSQYWGTASNPTLHNYSYLYDRLNRLANGTSDEGFNELITYDKMGNITSLNRNPMGTNTYSSTGNRLASISGFVNSSYTYDVNGNQTGDSHKGITLAYNHLNLPQTISKASTSETMTNTWLATGTKIRKTVGGMTREYIGGIEYNDGVIEFIQTSEGRAIPTGSSGYRYEYTLKDHLGNTRVLLEEDGTVLETSDYYPFGLQVARGQTVTSPENRYKYNGKELQTELGLGQYDYGARFYDPVIGRWNVIDPKAEKYRGLSPYNYVANNPLKYIDPDGKDLILSISKAKQGNHTVIQVKSTLNLTIVGNVNKDQIQALKETYVKNFSGEFPGSGDYGKRFETNRTIVTSDLNITVVDNIDNAKSTDHIMLMTDNIPGNAVGRGDLQGTSSAVENQTLTNNTFDEVASHELGHNLGLEHAEGGLMNKTVGNGQSGVTSGQLKQIYKGAATLPQGKTTLYNDPSNIEKAKKFKKELNIQ